MDLVRRDSEETATEITISDVTVKKHCDNTCIYLRQSQSLKKDNRVHFVTVSPVSLSLLLHPIEHLSAHDREGTHGLIVRDCAWTGSRTIDGIQYRVNRERK